MGMYWTVLTVSSMVAGVHGVASTVVELVEQKGYSEGRGVWGVVGCLIQSAVRLGFYDSIEQTVNLFQYSIFPKETFVRITLKFLEDTCI